MEPKGDIRKANLTFTANLLWLIVRYFLSPTAADNIVTWDHAVLMAAMIALWTSLGFYRWSCTKCFQSHKYLPFSVHDISLCRSAGVPI